MVGQNVLVSALKQGALSKWGRSGTVFYDRSAGDCYFESGGNWTKFDTTAASTAIADASQKILLPPIVNLRQSDALNTCRARTDLANANISGISTDLQFDLRLEKSLLQSQRRSMTPAIVIKNP